MMMYTFNTYYNQIIISRISYAPLDVDGFIKRRGIVDGKL